MKKKRSGSAPDCKRNCRGLYSRLKYFLLTSFSNKAQTIHNFLNIGRCVWNKVSSYQVPFVYRSLCGIHCKFKYNICSVLNGSCDSGYWGSPTEPGGACRRCECGGGPCHARAGHCLVCPPHAEGERCDQCQVCLFDTSIHKTCQLLYVDFPLTYNSETVFSKLFYEFYYYSFDFSRIVTRI